MYCRRVVRNFLGQGSFLKISAKIRIFSRLWNYMLTLQWVLSRFCSVTVIVLIYNKISPYMHHHGWRRTNICILTFLEASKTHFWCSLKVNKKPNTVSWTWRLWDGDSAQLPPTCTWRTLFSKTNVTFKYKIFYN